MQCMTGSFGKASRWAPKPSAFAIARAAESELPIDCHFGKRSTPMVAFERPQGLAVAFDISQWAIVVSEDRVLAAFAAFAYSCVQLRLWNVGHQVAAVLHQCYMNAFKLSFECTGRAQGAKEGVSLRNADILLYTLCRSREVAPVFPNWRASPVSEPQQAISMQQLHAQRSSDILLLPDTCVSVCAQIQTVGSIHWLHPRAIMVATLYDSIVICPGAPKRLLECLVFHKSLIRYVDPHPPEWYEQKLHATSYSEQVSHQTVPHLMPHLHTPLCHTQSLHLQPCLRHAQCCRICCRQQRSGMSLQRRWAWAYESHCERHVQPAPTSCCMHADPRNRRSIRKMKFSMHTQRPYSVACMRCRAPRQQRGLRSKATAGPQQRSRAPARPRHSSTAALSPRRRFPTARLLRRRMRRSARGWSAWKAPEKRLAASTTPLRLVPGLLNLYCAVLNCTARSTIITCDLVHEYFTCYDLAVRSAA